MGRGGKREGGGGTIGNQNAAKVKVVDSRTVRALDRILKKKAAEHEGSTWLDELVELAYDSGAMQTARLGALKMIADIKGVIVKQSHKTVDETKRLVAPVILPPMADDPAKLDMDGKPEEPRH